MNPTHSTTPLLAVDPALPQRDVLVDQTIMAQYLSRLVARFSDFGIKDCERLRTKYRVGASLRVLYQVTGNGHAFRIAARAFPRTQRIANRFPPTPEIYAPELNTIFWVFPNDRKIKNLVLLAGIPKEQRSIEGREWTESRIVGHVPEKSVTAQCLDHDRKILAYAKIYAGEEGQKVYDAYREIQAALKSETVQLRIPRALSYSARDHLLLLEPFSGVSLSALTPAKREHAYSCLGKALKILHKINPPSSNTKSLRLTPPGLRQAAATIGQARPEVARLAQRLASRLIAAHRSIPPARPVLLHGDLHPKNVLVDDERLVLLDLDQAATGAAALDLGSVIAGLYCEMCVGSLKRAERSSLQNAFLKGYGLNKQSQASLRWYVAAALLEERAQRSVTRIRFDSLRKLAEILTLAEAVLNGGICEN